MKSEAVTKSANYLRIVSVLDNMLEQEQITLKEYRHAKEYYQQLTGADIVIADKPITQQMTM
jgi:hypothetical protein